MFDFAGHGVVNPGIATHTWETKLDFRLQLQERCQGQLGSSRRLRLAPAGPHASTGSAGAVPAAVSAFVPSFAPGPGAIVDGATLARASGFASLTFCTSIARSARRILEGGVHFGFFPPQEQSFGSVIRQRQISTAACGEHPFSYVRFPRILP